jgi:outer membrane protein assembly factor BamB
VNRLFILIIALFFLNNCSHKENKSESNKNIKKIFDESSLIVKEFNPELILDLSKIKTKKKIINNKNNYGFQNYDGSINKIGNYKFSKIEATSQLDFKPIFLKDGLIFFDKKGSIIRYDNNQKILWKKNYYLKAEKKLKPRLNFVLDNENLIVTDSIAKYYSININSGKLNWSKNNSYPFNSEIKKNKKNFFVVDYKNILRCYNIKDGSECWYFQTEESFTVSNSKFSLIIIDDIVVFNNSIGDITAVDIETGLIRWQLPTQSNSIINEAYNFKISKLVADKNSIYFSNNKNEFYSINIKTGITNWINEINSNLTPIISSNLIFTISNDGFLHIVDKNKGNIIRITNIFKNYKIKKRKNISPIGFSIGNKKLYLTSSDGKMTIVDLNTSNIIRTVKISRNFTSKPFIFNQNLFIIKKGSIVQYN